MTDDIPAVCLISDLARILKCSERTLRKRIRAKALRIPELPAIDKRHRWSGEAVRQYLASSGTGQTWVGQGPRMRRAS